MILHIQFSKRSLFNSVSVFHVKTGWQLNNAALNSVRFTGMGLYTCTVEEELLSPGTSPAVAGPEAEPGATPFENNRLPETVWGPPIGYLVWQSKYHVKCLEESGLYH